MQKIQQRAFTLIELLIVIAIISILVSLSVGVSIKLQTRAEKQRNKALLTQIKLALDMSAQDMKKYPEFVGSWDDGDWGMARANSQMLYQELVVVGKYLEGKINKKKTRGDTDNNVANKDLDNDPGWELIDSYGMPFIYVAPDSTGKWPSGAREPENAGVKSAVIQSAGENMEFDDLHITDNGDDKDFDNIAPEGAVELGTSVAP